MHQGYQEGQQPYTPVTLTPDGVMGSHPDLRPGEWLVQLANADEVRENLARAVAGLRAVLMRPALWVTIPLGSLGTLELLQEIDTKLIGDVRKLFLDRRTGTISMDQAPTSDELLGRSIVFQDGMIERGTTMRAAAAYVRGLVPPEDHSSVEIVGFAAVERVNPHRVFDFPVVSAMSVTAPGDIVGISDGQTPGNDTLDKRMQYGLPGLWLLRTDASSSMEDPLV